MAEGFLKHMGGDKYKVSSAGLEASSVNPRAIQVMQELGIDISNHTSDNVQDYLKEKFDYVITVCDNANEHCPFFPGDVQRLHWSFKDPAEVTGTEEEILSVFRTIRDQIAKKIQSFI